METSWEQFSTNLYLVEIVWSWYIPPEDELYFTLSPEGLYLKNINLCDKLSLLKWRNEANIPSLKTQFLAAPDVDGKLSVSNLSWDSKPHGVGSFEEFCVSGSLAGGSMLPAMSVVKGLCLAQPQDLSPLNPSLSSSASLEVKPC